MIITIDEITNKVRAVMGRAPSPRRLIECWDPDEVSLEARIIENILPAARHVYSSAPMHVLAEAARDMQEEGIYWHHEASATRGDGFFVGHILLPHDFFRLLVFEMSDWERPVYHTIDAESPYFDVAISGYGAGASPCRPVCVDDYTSHGHCLTFFACRSSAAQIVQAKYVPIPHFDPDGGMDLAPRAVDLIVREIAGMLN